MASAQKSLKQANLKWLIPVLTGDAALYLLLLPVNAEAISLPRGVAVALLPLLVLLLTSLVSANVKAALVFWRVSDVLPGHRAFSVHAVGDPRIDIERLRKHVGAFPDSPREENGLWYRLFKKVDKDVVVSAAHGHYLLFRDLAAMSVLLVPLPLVAALLGFAEAAEAGAIAVLFLSQYVVAAVAARNTGNRMVAHVLSLHSLKRI